MSFQSFPEQKPAVELLQRSLANGRLGHAYLFGGTDLEQLSGVARTLAKTLNCANPPQRSPEGRPLDSCDQCPSCRKIDQEQHPDVQWVRPESKSRVITIDQMRGLMQTVYLKPNQADCKVSIIVAADRLNVQAANAFLKTLEEPPANSILILLTTEPQRILETIISRCLRLNFSGEAAHLRNPQTLEWIAGFSEIAAKLQKSLLMRYQLLSVLLNRLNQLKAAISEQITARSPLERVDDIEPALRERWEDELTAAIEAEYRRQRTELLSSLQWWMRDIWLATQSLGKNALTFPNLGQSVEMIARRIGASDAVQNLEQLESLQRLLSGNVQEALALEVGLLRLKL
jgi:DNA polymerase-3 subunit delta'